MVEREHTPECFRGWQEFPKNLSLSLLHVDSNRCSVRLSQDSERLFVSDKDSRLWALVIGNAGVTKDGQRDVRHVTFQGSSQLASYLEQSSSSTHVFFIRQSFSWGRLLISENMLRKLFTSQNVHPSFLDVVHIFGEKAEPVEESFSAFFYHPLSQYQVLGSESPYEDAGYVIGYNIKYVAGHGRPFLKDPYSVRETGVFQLCANSSTSAQRCSWVFIHASDALEERLGEVFKNAKQTTCALQFQIHALVLLSVSDNWRTYINYLEESFRRLLERGFYTNINGPTVEGDIDTDFSDIRKLQLLTDKLRRLCHILQLNINLGAQLKSCMQQMKDRTCAVSSSVSSFDSFNSQMDLFVSQHRTHLARIESLVSRAQGVSGLIQNILDIRTAESSSRINTAVHDITQQGIQENKLIKQLTHQSTQDTRAMKLIALISAIFLPATFVAVGLFWRCRHC